jgi:hypothetical protein
MSISAVNKTLVLTAAALLALPLAGCSSGLLGGVGKSGVPNAMNVPTSGPLSLPPDLRLPAPGTAAYQPVSPDVSQPAAQVASGGVYGGNAPLTRGEAIAAANPQVDIYERYGISKLKPDGTPKSQEQLKAELKAAIIAEKRRTNPGYGTFRNIGAIFKEG